MKEGILLIKSVDDTFQQPLLENQGYRVRITTPNLAMPTLADGEFRLVLVATESSSVTAVALCELIKARFQNVRVALLAQRAEYVPKSTCIDAVIRSQYSPNRFLATIRNLMDGNVEEARRAIAADNADGD